MADMDGGVGGTYGRHSWIPARKSDDSVSVDRHSERGSKTNGGAISAARSGRAMARNKSQNAGGCGGCKLSDAAEEANKLANTLALLLPEFPVRVVLPGSSPSCGGGFSGEALFSMDAIDDIASVDGGGAIGAAPVAAERGGAEGGGDELPDGFT